MPDFAEPLARLITEFKRLPGIGQKSAQRMAFYVLRTGRDDFAGGFVAHDQRRATTAGRAIPAVDIAAADAAGANPQQHFVRRGLRGGKIDVFKFRGRGEQQGFHQEGRVAGKVLGPELWRWSGEGVAAK